MIAGAKIKVFKFKATTHDAQCFEHDKNIAVDDEKFIEKTISDFLMGKSYIDMKIVVVDDNYHNNGRNNTSHLVYTIIYK